MALLLDNAQSRKIPAMQSSDGLTIGLVNNMPDAAFEATERQFATLIRAATTDVVVRLKLFSIPGVPRVDYMRHALAERYRDISELCDTSLDGLIVTGTEPRAANLADEPYWPALTKLVDWARDNTASTIWSCLAAHAAVFHADGIERRPLKEKLFGVFDCERMGAHPVMSGVARLRVPHSRYNDLPEEALAASGYCLLTRSAAAGIDTFAREERGSSQFLFFQGHPEYEATTLVREYRRDIGRFLKGQREHYPAMPQELFNDEAMAIANEFRARALVDRRNDLIGSFPMSVLEVGLKSTWRISAIAIYKNWIRYLRARKAEGRTLTFPLRRTWRKSPGGGVQPVDHSTK